MTWRTVPTIAVALAIVAAALAVIGGRHDSALDPVADAANATTRAGSVEFRLTGNVSAAGQSIPLNGGGAMDPQNLRARMSISTSIPGLGPAVIDEIMNGTAIYLHMPQQLASRLPGGKAWMKIDLQSLGKTSGIDFQKALQQSSGQQNPADMLGYLKAVGESRVVGHEAIRGSDTTHYAATIDIAKAADRIGDKQTADRFEQLQSSMGIGRMPVDVWVDRSGLVRREQVKMAAGQGAQSFAMDMTIDFLRFGVSVDATPPPADQVMDLSALLGSAAAGSGQP